MRPEYTTRLPTPRDLKGDIISPNSLPPTNTKRWIPNRKAIVVRAVEYGLVSLAEVLERYHMTEGEFTRWHSELRAHGADGLKVTHSQAFRGVPRAAKRKRMQDASEKE